MGDLQFEWDAAKARANIWKHGITFPEGASIFADPFARLEADDTVRGEARQVLVGLSNVGRLLVVDFVDRGRIRIISTRRATPFERNAYEEARR